MDDDEFRAEVEKGLGAAVILAGSGSDAPHVQKLYDSIIRYGIPVQARVASAHKQPELITTLVHFYDNLSGPLVYVAVAGGSDALSGVVSWATNRPVITSSPDHPNQSALSNPPGSSNAYIPRPDNVARFIAQMFSYVNLRCREVLGNERQKKINDLNVADENFVRGDFGGDKK